MSAPIDPKALASVLSPDPIDIGALLRAALASRGHTAASVSRLTGIAPPNVSRALRSPDTRPATARRILRAIGATLEVKP